MAHFFTSVSGSKFHHRAAHFLVDKHRLGHSTTKTTLDTYSHVFAESKVKAMQAIDMALFRQSDTDKEETPLEKKKA